MVVSGEVGSSQQFREWGRGRGGQQPAVPRVGERGAMYSMPTPSKTNVEVVLSVSLSTSTAGNARASVMGSERYSPACFANLAKGSGEIETPELKHQ